jgi:hypothetical protein
MLAYDSKPITLPKDIFAGLTQKNFNDNKDAIITGVRSALSSAKLRKGLALDAGMKSFAKAIDAFAELDGDEASEEVEGAEKIGPIDKPEPQKKDFGKGGKGFGSFPDGGETKDSDQFGESGLGVTTFDKAAVVDFLKGKGMADDAIEEFGVMMAPVWQKLEGAVGGKAPGNDSEEAMKKKAELEAQGADEEAEEAAKKKKDKDMIDKPAMDAALAAHGKRIRETERGIRVALAEVKPWVGDLPATLAFDSAADVYRHSLTMLGVEGAKTLHPDALAPVLKAQKRPGASSETRQTENSIAMDASSVSRAVKLAPGLANIQNVT